MNKDKIIVYYDWYLDLRAGGPTGYLANLRYGLDRITNPENFVVEFFTQKKTHSIVREQSFIIKIMMSNYFLKRIKVNLLSKHYKKIILNQINFLKNIDDYFVPSELIQKLMSENVSYVHCHHVVDVIKLKNTLRKYNLNNIKIIFTSHMPEAPSCENFSLCIEQGYSLDKAKKIKELWKVIEQKAFNYADLFIFPSKEAMEPYFDTISNFSSLLNSKPLYFVQSGVVRLHTDLDDGDIFKKYNLPPSFKNKKIISYIGRHNSIKGYDLLIKVAKKILNNRDDVLFLIGGKINSMIQFPKNLITWKECGFVEPSEILKISNLFVLPNKRTFFDLILLEVLSSGIPVLASNTGGNKTVYSNSNNLIYLFDSEDDFYNKINFLLDKLDSTNFSQQISSSLIKFYENNYTPELFADRYLKCLNSIINNKL